MTQNKLRYTWDTVGVSNVCDEALSDDDAICNYGSILTNRFPRVGVKCTSTTMYTMFGEGFYKYGKEFSASKDDFEFAKTWMNLTEKLVAEDKVRPHPKRLGMGGLEGVLKGLEELKAGKVSGEKLVYRI